MGALLIKVFENNEIYALKKCFFNAQSFIFNFFQEIYNICAYIQLQTESVAFIL